MRRRKNTDLTKPQGAKKNLLKKKITPFLRLGQSGRDQQGLKKTSGGNLARGKKNGYQKKERDTPWRQEETGLDFEH